MISHIHFKLPSWRGIKTALFSPGIFKILPKYSYNPTCGLPSLRMGYIARKANLIQYFLLFHRAF
jgi:hypothetical protein